MIWQVWPWCLRGTQQEVVLHVHKGEKYILKQDVPSFRERSTEEDLHGEVNVSFRKSPKKEMCGFFYLILLNFGGGWFLFIYVCRIWFVLPPLAPSNPQYLQVFLLQYCDGRVALVWNCGDHANLTGGKKWSTIYSIFRIVDQYLSFNLFKYMELKCSHCSTGQTSILPPPPPILLPLSLSFPPLPNHIPVFLW